MAGRVAGDLEHREAGDLVALAQRARDRMRWTGPEALLKGVQPARRLAVGDRSGSLHRVHVLASAPKRDLQPFADRVTRALVVGMRMRQRVRAELAPFQLVHDPRLGLARAGVDQ